MIRYGIGLMFLGLVLCITSAADAATIATGPIGSPGDSGQVRCRAVNISSKPQVVAVMIYNQLGTLLTIASSTVPPASTELGSATLSAGQSAYCVIDIKGGKSIVRGELCIEQLSIGRHYCVSAR